MFTGYSTVSSVVVLWLMLGYFCFSYLIRIVVFLTGIALCATIQRAIPVNKHNYPYQVRKIEVLQHQP